MKKIMIINGSPRGKKGNTAIMVERFLEGYRSVEVDCMVDHIELYKEKIKTCIGCFNCWTKTPGKCIQNDSMKGLLDKYNNADLIIWATPIYHYEMTSLLKVFVERTLPLVHPLIVQDNGEYTHPKRFNGQQGKNIIISNCGFPDFTNFDILQDSFDKITRNSVDERIYCVMGELLSKPPLERRLNWYIDALKDAGAEYAKEGRIKEGTKKALNKPLVPIDDFIEMANASWDINTLDSSKLNDLDSNIKGEKGLSYLKLMKHSFVAQNADGIDVVLEIEFTDLNETNHFIIKENSCQVCKGHNDFFTTKIITNFEAWTKISNGELDSVKAMMDGLYRVEGDFNFMMSMGDVFGSGSKEDRVDNSFDIEKKDIKVLGIKQKSWMGICFIPWILSWAFISFSDRLGIFIPFILSFIILSIKKKHDLVTYFEQMTFQYFSLLSILKVFGGLELGLQGVLVNYFAIAIIWVSSLFNKNSLTCDYSKYDFNGSIEKNLLFIRTNKILTLFWSIIFVIQGILFIVIKDLDLLKYSAFLYILTFVALKFTDYFSTWYPKYIAGGGKFLK